MNMIHCSRINLFLWQNGGIFIQFHDSIRGSEQELWRVLYGYNSVQIVCWTLQRWQRRTWILWWCYWWESYCLLFFFIKRKKREKYDHRVLRAKNKCSDISSIELAAPQRMRFAAHLMSDNPAGSTAWRNRQVHTVMYNFSRFFHKMFI